MASPGTQHDFLDPPKDENSLGTLGHYNVVRELGKGGMGYVFLGVDVRLKRQVALKVMNKKIAATPGSRKRFISEARSMAAVHHDNVATIFEVGEHKGTPYMAMELLEGATLENYRQEHGAPDYKQIIAFAKDIARGLNAAHEKGIVHRDIKPANIWLDTKTNRIKILDFGLALAQTPVDQLSGRGSVVGTPGYLSPEQARSEPLDDRSDLYSAGVVLYELACGALPLKSKTVAEQLIAILAHAPQPLRERNQEIPEPLAELIHQLMAKEPRDRFASAKMLLSELEKAEVECEKKSEVAQAISQLQAGLEQAVKKKSGQPDPDFGFDSGGSAPPNPFDSLPDVFSDPAPNAIPQSPSGVHPAVTLPAAAPATPSAATRAPAKRPASDAGSGMDPQRKLIYLIVGIAAGLLLITIPVVAYLSSTSAIARQQNQGVSIIRPDADQQDQQVSPSPMGNQDSANQRRNQASPSGNAKAKNPGGDGNAKNPAGNAKGGDRTNAGNKAPPITPVAAKEIEDMASPGSKWIISNKQNNGSFEVSSVTKSQPKIPGWTLQTSGPDAGWGLAPTARQPEAKTFVYAGAKSAATLTSETLNHRVKPGDVFRVGAIIGGEGPGMTDYKVVMGFRDDDKDPRPIRYGIADIANGARWGGGKQGRLRYEFTAKQDVAGKQPFLELTVSNTNRARKRGMLDRVVVTVVPAAALAKNASTPNNAPSRPSPSRPSQPKPDPKQLSSPTSGQPDPSMVSVAKPAAESSKPAAAAAPPPAPKPSRVVTLKTTDQGGADTTVRRGGSTKDPLGGKKALEIQTRNDAQIQHVYLRFPILQLSGKSANNGRNRGGGRNGAQTSALPVLTAKLELAIAEYKSPQKTTVRVFGLDSAVSDIWPEERLVWANSLSESNLEGLKLLAEIPVTAADKTLRVDNKALIDFIANASQRSVTLVLTGSTGNEWIEFAAKEDTGRSPPTLVVGME